MEPFRPFRRKYVRGWIVLPPSIQDRIEARGDPDILLRAFDKIWADPKRKRELEERTDNILAYLDLFPSGWSSLWPDDLEDSSYIGAVLGTTLTQGLDESILEMPEEVLTSLEKRCRRDGLEVEEALIEMFIESRED